MFGEEDLLLN